MKNVIDNLKERYKSFIDEKEVRNFFFGLADYVRYIENTPNLYSIIKSEVKGKEELLKEKNEFEEKSLQELMIPQKALLKIVEKKKIASEELKEAIKYFELFEKGKIQMRGDESDKIEGYLWDIGKALYGLGYKKELKKFIDENPRTGNTYLDNKNFIFSNSLPKRHQLDKNIADLREKKIWGCWDYLKYVPLFWIDGKKWEEVIPVNFESEIDRICFDLYNLLKMIEKDNSTVVVSFIDQEKSIKDYRFYTNRIHLHLLEKLTTATKSEIKTDEKAKIKKITVIEMNNGKHLIAVNDNYEEIRKIQNHSDWWQIFIREVKERNMRPETRTNVKEISKGMADYFNYNITKCPIYMGGKYEPTNIFFGQSIDIMINSDIKTEILTEKQYLARKKKVRRK